MNSRYRPLSILTIAFLSCVAIDTRHAEAGETARLIELSGTVEVERVIDGVTTWQPAIPGTPLGDGAFLRTGKDGLATIQASDGTMYKVRPGTLFEVRDSKGVLEGPGAAANVDATSARPPGIPENRWVALAPGVGIALREPSPHGGVSLEGTLWVSRGHTWVRVQLTAPPAIPREVVPAR
jgi:hypothetical protein